MIGMMIGMMIEMMIGMMIDDRDDCDDIPRGDADVMMSVAGRDCPHGCQHKSGLCQPFLAL